MVRKKETARHKIVVFFFTMIIIFFTSPSTKGSRPPEGPSAGEAEDGGEDGVGDAAGEVGVGDGETSRYVRFIPGEF